MPDRNDLGMDFRSDDPDWILPRGSRLPSSQMDLGDSAIRMRAPTVSSKSTAGLGEPKMGIATGVAAAGVATKLWGSYQQYKAQKAAQKSSDREFAVNLRTGADQARASAQDSADVAARLAPARDIGFYASMNMLNPSQRQGAYEKQFIDGKRRGNDPGRALREEPILQPGYANRVLADAGYGARSGARSGAESVERKAARGGTLSQDEYRDWSALSQRNNAKSQRRVAAHFEPGGNVSHDHGVDPPPQDSRETSRDWASMTQGQERPQMPPTERYDPMGGRGTIPDPMPPGGGRGPIWEPMPPGGGGGPTPWPPGGGSRDWPPPAPGPPREGPLPDRREPTREDRARQARDLERNRALALQNQAQGNEARERRGRDRYAEETAGEMAGGFSPVGGGRIPRRPEMSPPPGGGMSPGLPDFQPLRPDGGQLDPAQLQQLMRQRDVWTQGQEGPRGGGGMPPRNDWIRAAGGGGRL
jgi:hypothetical protein